MGRVGWAKKEAYPQGGSPGLVAMGDDSCSEKRLGLAHFKKKHTPGTRPVLFL